MKKTNTHSNNSVVSESFVKNASFLHRFLGRFLSNKQDIEDVAQEAYLRAYVAEQSKDIDHPKALIFTVAKNLAINKLKQKSSQITQYLDEIETVDNSSVDSSADELNEAKQVFQIYCGAVLTLKDKAREVFLLRKVHGLSHKEIANKMGISVSSTEKYLRQAVIQVNKYVNQSETIPLKTRLGRGVLPR